MVRQKTLFICAFLSAVLTIIAGAEPSFGQVAGAPLGLGIVSAGFAIAGALNKT